jgi:hypothetical protein
VPVARPWAPGHPKVARAGTAASGSRWHKRTKAMDYQATLYDPLYTVQGVDGTINGVEGFTVLDKTAGIEFKMEDGVKVQTVTCAAIVRARELQELGVELDALEDGVLRMNGSEWRIESFKLDPSPKGQRDGQVILILQEETELDEPSEYLEDDEESES